jgi:nicotinate-nucleotide adenylyltransferase
MKQAIVFGGAFNPPTVAHVQILQETVKFASSHDMELWLLPSGSRVDKTIECSREQRLLFLDAMVSDVDLMGVPVVREFMELDRGYNVETYDSVVELDIMYPDREFTWVFGADSTMTMPQWSHGDWLLQNLRMLLVNRPGSILNPACVHYDVMSVITPDVSSTELRNRIALGLDFADLVTPTVKKTLEEMLVINH